MRLFSYDDPDHREASELLPWYANGTLDRAERLRVEQHLAECIACKQELAGMRSLRGAILADDPDVSGRKAWRRMQARLEHAEAGGRIRRGWLSLAGAWRTAPGWMRGAVLAQAVVVAVLAVLSWRAPAPASPAYYHTLSASPAAAPAGDIVVVFDATRSEREIRGLLLGLHANIADGPTAEGAYVLSVPRGSRQAALAALRRNVAVVFAEPSQQAAQSP